MPRTANRTRKKSGKGSVGDPKEVIPKYLHFGKASLAAYVDESGQPLHMKEHDDADSLLSSASIVSSRSQANSEWARRPGMAMTCSSMHWWLANLEDGDFRKATATVVTWSKTDKGKKIMEAIDGLNLGRDGTLTQSKIEKHVKTIVSFLSDLEENKALSDAIVTMVVQAGQMYLGSMGLAGELGLDDQEERLGEEIPAGSLTASPRSCACGRSLRLTTTSWRVVLWRRFSRRSRRASAPVRCRRSSPRRRTPEKKNKQSSSDESGDDEHDSDDGSDGGDDDSEPKKEDTSEDDSPSCKSGDSDKKKPKGKSAADKKKKAKVKHTENKKTGKGKDDKKKNKGSKNKSSKRSRSSSSSGSSSGSSERSRGGQQEDPLLAEFADSQPEDETHTDITKSVFEGWCKESFGEWRDTVNNLLASKEELALDALHHVCTIPFPIQPWPCRTVLRLWWRR